jgi:hypothetical protein
VAGGCGGACDHAARGSVSGDIRSVASGALARKWPTALVVLVIVAAVWSVRAPIGTRIIKRQLAAAETAEQQEAALCRMDAWARNGHAAGSYTLRTLDADGVEIRPTHDGRWDRVATLIIEWTDGSKSTIQLLGRDGLSCAFHG